MLPRKSGIICLINGLYFNQWWARLTRTLLVNYPKTMEEMEIHRTIKKQPIGIAGARSQGALMREAI